MSSRKKKGGAAASSKSAATASSSAAARKTKKDDEIEVEVAEEEVEPEQEDAGEIEAENEGNDVDDKDGDDVDEEGDANGDEPPQTSTVPGPDNLDYSIFNLSAYEPVAFDVTAHRAPFTEDELKLRSRDNVQRLVNHIFALPSTPMPNEPGRLVSLLHSSSSSSSSSSASSFAGPVPRARPLPKPKAPTKWELFARKKGITKRKKDRVVLDEATGEYAPRWGYKRANDDSQNVIIEHKEGDDSTVDPWTKSDRERDDRRNKNKKQQQSNQSVALGEAKRKLPGTIDLTTAVPSSGSHKTSGHTHKQSAKRQKTHSDVALAIAQSSTASVGKFDEQRFAEPARPKQKESHSVSHSRTAEQEKSNSMKMLAKMMGNEADTTMEKGKLNTEAAANFVKNKLQSRDANAKKSHSHKSFNSNKNKGSGSRKSK